MTTKYHTSAVPFILAQGDWAIIHLENSFVDLSRHGWIYCRYDIKGKEYFYSQVKSNNENTEEDVIGYALALINLTDYVNDKVLGDKGV